MHGAETVKQTALEWGYASIYGAGISYTEPFHIKAIGAIWFLLATFFGSVFLRSTLNMKSKTRIIVILALFAFGYWSRELFWFPFSIQAGCCATLFMYLGYLLKNNKDSLKKLSFETKVVFSILALMIWIDFIKNFQSFFLVQCDIGRGVIDILGSICGCYIVILISWSIEKYTRHLANALAFLGKYSLFMLCIHIIELNLIPWRRVVVIFIKHGMPIAFDIYIIILLKFIFIISLTVICSKCNFIRRLFGFSDYKNLKSEKL